MKVSRTAFERLVAEALDSLPRAFAERIENLVVVVEDEPTEEELLDVGLTPGEDELFGLYQGIPLTEREWLDFGLPDRVVIYRGPISRVCRDRHEIVREVRDTVVHELGHHFGLEDDEMPY